MQASSIDPLQEILELARWAPSGDNAQQWRFEIAGPRHLVVHAHDTRDHCVYDLDGRASQLAWGALLETIAIAASDFGLRSDATRRESTRPDRAVLDVRFAPDSAIVASPLLPFVTQRSVQRRPLKMRALSVAEKASLRDAVAPDFELIWLEGADKLAAARLMFASAKLRLTIPEAYEVHRAIIDWGKRFSEDKVPDQAIGLDAATLLLMRWVMASWDRVAFFNRWLAGTLAPRIQLDLLPGIACAAHFGLVARAAPTTVDDFVAGGRAVQRFWLTATQLGLQLQPEMTPLIFARYARADLRFSNDSAAQSAAAAIDHRLAELLGASHVPRTVFLGRIGHGKAPLARSLRKPLTALRLPG